MRNAPAVATFTLAGLAGETQVEVIGEGRALKATGGKFSDPFDGYGVHVYRVK